MGWARRIGFYSQCAVGAHGAQKRNQPVGSWENTAMAKSNYERSAKVGPISAVIVEEWWTRR